MSKIRFGLSLIAILVILINVKSPIEAGEQYTTASIEPLISKSESTVSTEDNNLITAGPDYIITVSDEEIDLMARVVMSEASILGIDAKQAIAQTIVNRVRDGRWGETVTDVINYPNAYSTYNNGYPNNDCYAAVEYALMYEAFPEDMYYFRTDYYHDFGYPYCHIENTYFSTEFCDYGGI